MLNIRRLRPARLDAEPSPEKCQDIASLPSSTVIAEATMTPSLRPLGECCVRLARTVQGSKGSQTARIVTYTVSASDRHGNRAVHRLFHHLQTQSVDHPGGGLPRPSAPLTLSLRSGTRTSIIRLPSTRLFGSTVQQSQAQAQDGRVDVPKSVPVTTDEYHKLANVYLEKLVEVIEDTLLEDHDERDVEYSVSSYP